MAPLPPLSLLLVELHQHSDGVFIFYLLFEYYVILPKFLGHMPGFFFFFVCLFVYWLFVLIYHLFGVPLSGFCILEH